MHPIMDDYLERMASYHTMIMRRATYEFGYRFGLEPGAKPYPQAKTIVVSTSLTSPPNTEVSIQRQLDADWVDRLRTESDGSIYLCGGGYLTAATLERGRLDILNLKRALIILGAGTPLFTPLATPPV